MSSLSTLPKGDSAWLLRKSIQRIMQQVSVLETNIGSSTTGNSANTQVIFNDNGVLRGDAGLTYNATTDLLTVSSATITGDLTVRTNKLAVTSTGVGCGTASPTEALHVNRSSGTGVFIRLQDSANSNYIGTDNGNFRILNGTSPVYDLINIQQLGVFTFGDGAGGTRMTLNATGLGIGLAPVGGVKLSVAGTIYANAGNALILDNPSSNFVAQIKNTGSSLQSTLAFLTGSGTSMLIDNSGNVGIGVTPSAWGAGYTALQNRQTCWFATSSRDLNLGANVYVDAVGYKYIATAAASNYVQFQGAHSWYNAPSGTAGTTITDFATAKMTLDASGNLLVGVTSTTTPGVGNTTAGGSLNANGAAFFSHASSQALYLNTNVDGQIVSIRRSNVAVGSISVTTTGTTFNSLSDYRLKEAVAPLSGGLARISALKPSVYKWKADGSNGEGFLAHELAEVVPLAVTGEKDAVNEDGSIKAQGVDLSKVVPILVAAIQELTARVQTLETR